MRVAEQRWPAERKAELITSSVTCSGSAVASTIMALMPPVSAISGTIGPSFAGERPVDLLRHLGRAGEDDAGDPRIGDEGGADRTVARNELERRGGHAGRCRSRTASKAISGVCSAGLATTLLPAASAAGDLTDEDGERKVPRTDRDEDAATAQAVAVLLAGRAGEERVGEQAGAPQPHSSGRSRPPRGPRRRRRRWSCRPPAQGGPSGGRGSPRGDRRRVRGSGRARRGRIVPASKASSRGLHGSRRTPGSSGRHRANEAAVGRREDRDLRGLRRFFPSIRGDASTAGNVVLSIADSRGRARGLPVAELDSLANCGAGANRSAGKAIRRWRAGWPASARCGGTSRLSIGTLRSLTALTKDELAPFSRSRLTR